MIIKYKGYVASQSSYNNHVIITKDGRMVFHANCTKKKSKNELEEMVDWYIDFVNNKFDEVYNHENGEA